MALVASSATAEKIMETSSQTQSIGSSSSSSSPSRRVSDAASDSSSSSSAVPVNSSTTTTTNNNNDPSSYDQPNSNSSPSSQKDLDTQSPAALRSEEYRQLFRLPLGEVLVQDFNCALQESILFQGHMYVFLHCICFYSNIFGFETKKTIQFYDITCIRRAKTAGIFPNAIEIIAGEKKYFFASFLSRDEAFKLIEDSWLQHGNVTKSTIDLQESISEPSTPDSEFIKIENVKRTQQQTDEFDTAERNEDACFSNVPELPSSAEVDRVTVTQLELQDTIREEAEPVSSIVSTSTEKSQIWKQEDLDAPKVPECYTKVAETKFPIGVEEFFGFFFSDAAAGFIESFHRKCGDKDFRCTPWCPHDKYGRARELSFQHPIKLYFGAKFGSCREIQKFRVYRKSHLIIETSQEIDDVPYADYFCVEGLWDVVRDTGDSENSCILRVYVNVAFSKSTVWKGKIVASTIDECREAYATWINIAHNELKQKKLEKQEEVPAPATGRVPDSQDIIDREAGNRETSKRSHKKSESRIRRMSGSKNENEIAHLVDRNVAHSNSIAFLIREYLTKIYAALRSQGCLPLLLVITVAVILLMQLSIVVLLSRPPQVQVVSQVDYLGFGRGAGNDRSSEALAWLEKQVHHLKDEMLMVESMLDRMRVEHKMLKAKMEDFQHLRQQS